MEEMQPYSLLTDHELDMIDQYRYAYANTSDGESPNVSNEDWCPINNLLQPWNDAKKRLFKAFNNKLIVSKHIVYNRDIEQLQDDLRDMIDKDEDNSFSEFIDNFIHLTSDSCFREMNAGNDIHLIWNLVDFEVLATNRWPYNDKAYIVLADGKKYMLQKNCKIIRAIGKIAESYNVPGFEKFRQMHSQVLNQKRLEGDITLSIHPLDYMTMSDNNCDWDTCMNWMGCGEYRMGTVEMMNSPYIVVAYLTCEEPFELFYGKTGYKWNSKKWRTLLVASEDFITNIRSYPYTNDFLALEVCKIMRDIMDAAYPDVYSKEPVIYHNGFDRFELPESDKPDETIKINWGTEHMYNDFQSTLTRALYYNKHLFSSKNRFNVKYSGPAQCMCCGIVYPELNCDGDLICCECSGVSLRYCTICGKRLYNGDSNYVDIDGNCYCEDCGPNELVQTADGYGLYRAIDCMTIDLIIGMNDGSYKHICEALYIPGTENAVANWNKERSHKNYQIKYGNIILKTGITFNNHNYILITAEQVKNYGEDYFNDRYMDYLFNSLEFSWGCCNIEELFNYYTNIMNDVITFEEII